jgi:hypothetical protein
MVLNLVKQTAKQFVFDLMIVVLTLYTTSFISGDAVSWMGWVVLAVKNAAVIAACILAANLVFYHNKSMELIAKIISKKR